MNFEAEYIPVGFPHSLRDTNLPDWMKAEKRADSRSPRCYFLSQALNNATFLRHFASRKNDVRQVNNIQSITKNKKKNCAFAYTGIAVYVQSVHKAWYASYVRWAWTNDWKNGGLWKWDLLANRQFICYPHPLLTCTPQPEFIINTFVVTLTILLVFILIFCIKIK